MTTDDMYLPRILCLHGGGVNAQVFRLQCRAILHRLSPHFRFVFVDAPFPCQPHDAIVSVYGEFKPFYRWLRWMEPAHPEIDPRAATDRVVAQCWRAMNEDPGTGTWVGVLGFSQGAKIASSLLWAQEHLPEPARPLPGVSFKFGIIMAGSAPIVLLDRGTGPPRPPKHLTDAGQLSMTFQDWPADSDGEHAVATPTLHVHGLQDPGLDLHRLLLKSYFKPGPARLMEWDGNHRLPIKSMDVDRMVNHVLQIAQEVDVL